MNSNQKEEFRFMFAGMAMQAIIEALWSNKETQDEVITNSKRRGFSNIKDFVAEEAVDFANALINELEEGDKQ